MDQPVLNRMQRSWLQEIGIDARMLAHFSTEPFASLEHERQAAAAPAPVAELPNGSGTAPQASPTVMAGQGSLPKPDARRGTSPGAAIIADLLNRSSGKRETVTSAPVYGEASLPADPQVSSLQALHEHVEQCTACGLHEVRGRVVFGEGAPAAPQWMFIGEAPGEYDDSTGRPFQGRAGELLRAMLAAVGFTEDTAVYFSNVLKCRPMGNRSPQAAEIAACLPLLQRQIRLLRPGCLVALGRVSAAALLGRDDDLDMLRGEVHRYIDEDGREIPLVVTHHPASLLLHGQLKAEAWRDLNLLAGIHTG